MVYSDDTHIPNENEIKNEIAKYPPDETSKTLSKWMREKKFGVDTREAMALDIEMNGGRTSNVLKRQNDVETQFKDVIENATKDSEVILARNSSIYGASATLDDRLEKSEKVLSDSQVYKLTADNGSPLSADTLKAITGGKLFGKAVSGIYSLYYGIKDSFSDWDMLPDVFKNAYFNIDYIGGDNNWRNVTINTFTGDGISIFYKGVYKNDGTTTSIDWKISSDDAVNDAKYAPKNDGLSQFEKLWEGVNVMKIGSTVTPSKKLSLCKNGWLLTWDKYAAESGTTDYAFVTTSFIPKKIVFTNQTNEGSIAFPIPLTGTTITVMKLLSYSDTAVMGFTTNDEGNNGSVVLTGVWSI